MLNLTTEEETALRQLVAERVEANRVAEAKAAAEEEARKRDREIAIARYDEEERIMRVRKELAKNMAPTEGVSVWYRGR